MEVGQQVRVCRLRDRVSAPIVQKLGQNRQDSGLQDDGWQWSWGADPI